MLRKLKIKKFIFPISLVFFLTAVGLAGFVYWDKSYSLEKNSSEEKSAREIVALKSGPAGRVLGEEEGTGPPVKFGSENYFVPQIVVGGEGGIYYPGAEDQKELLVSDVKSEIFTDKNKKDKKILLSWMTSKSAKSSIEYSKAGMEAGQKYDEAGYSLEHSVLLEPLDSLTTYNYVIKMRDRGGTAFETDKFAIYTGAPQISFLDMLLGAFKGVFGWAVK